MQCPTLSLLQSLELPLPQVKPLSMKKRISETKNQLRIRVGISNANAERSSLFSFCGSENLKALGMNQDYPSHIKYFDKQTNSELLLFFLSDIVIVCDSNRLQKH